APSPTQEEGNSARLDNGFLVLSKLGRVAERGSRPVEGTPKTVTLLSQEVGGWYVALSCAQASAAALPSSGQLYSPARPAVMGQQSRIESQLQRDTPTSR